MDADLYKTGTVLCKWEGEKISWLPAKILSHPVPGKPGGQWKVQWMIQHGGDFEPSTMRKETVLIVWFYTKRILDSSVISVTKPNSIGCISTNSDFIQNSTGCYGETVDPMEVNRKGWY